MAKIITLKYAGRCTDCGASLPVGARAKWYGRGRVYGLDCHARDYGVYASDGRKIGSSCSCEDYPCCGH